MKTEHRNIGIFCGEKVKIAERICQEWNMDTDGALAVPIAIITEHDDGDLFFIIKIPSPRSNEIWQKSAHTLIGHLWTTFKDGQLTLENDAYSFCVTVHSCDPD